MPNGSHSSLNRSPSNALRRVFGGTDALAIGRVVTEARPDAPVAVGAFVGNAEDDERCQKKEDGGPHF